MSGCPFHRDATTSGSSGPHGYSTAQPAAAPVQAAPPLATPQAIAEDDLQCPVCLRLLHEPTALPCGHSFCGPCLRTAEAEGRLDCCAVCRAGLPEGVLRLLRPNVLLAALIEKFLPEAAAARKAEAVEDHEEDRRRHTMVRQVALRLALQGRRGAVTVQMAETSRCPFHAGARVPVNFYVARVTIAFPPGWVREEASHWDVDSTSAEWVVESYAQDDVAVPDGSVKPGVPVRLQGLQSAPELNDTEGTCGQLDPESGRWRVYVRGGQAKSVREENMAPMRELQTIVVTLHFQPRFQIPPAHALLPLRHGERKHVDAEIDSRILHH
mmetsp:Transcript_89342/g.251549  ORF Transcript_89342/g.251549 Transcript_89342/m.251549 type:complete len:326 (-) Transcript_89342:117-1094(-)